MIKLEIKSIYGEVIFTHEKESNTIKETVEAFLEANKDKIIKNVNLSNLDLSTVCFDNSSFYNSSFYNSRFDKSSFYNSRFDKSSFYNSSFDKSSFYNSRFDNSSFYNSRFDKSRFYNSSFDKSSFYNSSFYNSRFDNSSFYNSRFDKSRFYNSRFDKSLFDDQTIENLRAASQLSVFDSYKNDFWAILLPAKKEVAGLIKALNEGRVDGATYTGECCCLVGTIAKVRGVHYESLEGIVPNQNRPAELWFMMIRKGMTTENSAVTKLTAEWAEEFLQHINN